LHSTADFANIGQLLSDFGMAAGLRP